MEPTQHKSNGALIGSIIIIVILIVAGIYLLKDRVTTDEKADTATTNDSQETSTTVEETVTSPSSDNLDDIEADLEMNADIDNLDSGLE